MAKRRIKKPVRKNKSDYPGEMSFRKALGMNPTYYQEGGKLYYQEDTGELPTTKYGTPEYEEAYRTGNLLVNGVRPLPEFKVTPEYKSLSDELRRAAILGTKEAAELTGVPGAVRFARSPVQSLKGAGNTIVDLGLTVSPFANMNPAAGFQYAKQGTNPLTGEGSFRPQDVEGAFNTLDAAGLATIVGAGLKAPLQQGLRQSAKNLSRFTPIPLEPPPARTIRTEFGQLSSPPPIIPPRQAAKQMLHYRDINSSGVYDLRSAEDALDNWAQLNRFEIPSFEEDAFRHILNRYNIPNNTSLDDAARMLNASQKPHFLRDIVSEVPRLMSTDDLFRARMNYQNSVASRARPGSKPVIKNKSGLTKEEALQKAAAKDKDVISKMSEEEFGNTVLKPNGEVASYYQGSLEPQFSGSQNVVPLSPKEYADEFNSKLDLLNDIIAQKNKSGVEYRVKGLDESGRLTFHTPQQSIKHGDVNLTIPSGESSWGVRLNPGQWRGNVEDIANTEYFRSIPGLEMSNTTQGVFADNIARRGTGAYEAINEYLKRLDLGRVKPGFNSQTDFSRGAWENFVKSGRAVGFYGNPRTVYGTMKTIAPPAAIIGAGAYGVNQMQDAQPTMQRFGGKLRYARGGSLTSAQDTAQAADLNKDVMRKDIKKASVGEDFLAGLYGVGEGLLDTVTFGLTDELTDAGFKGLQAAAGHDINSDEAKRQAGIAGWGNVAGAVTGAIINPGAIGSAAEEGLEGIGTGIEGIDPNSGIATGIGTSLKGMGSSKMLSGLNDKDKIPQGMQGFSKLFMARNGGRFRYGYQGGGHMVNQNMGLTEIDGPSHEEGGVTLPNRGGRPDVEVEGPETIYTPENYVMSEKMKASKEALEYAGITGKAASRLAGKSYADLSKSIKSKAGDKLRPADPLSKKMLDKEMKRLMKAHEYDREVKRMKDEAMRSQMMGGSNIVAETPEERAGGYNMYPNAESIAFPGSGPTSVVPTYNNDPIMVTGADGSQQMLTDEPIETEAPFIEEKMAQGGKMIKRADGSYSRRGLWDNIRANRGSGKKPTKQMLEQEAKIKAKMQVGGRLDPLALTKTIFNPNDESTVENVMEVFDPSGISSWDDVYKSYQESGMSPATQLEIFGALPLLGKVGKLGKAIQRTIDLSKLGRSGSRFGKMDRNEQVLKSVLGTGLFVSPYVGRLTDAAQAVQQYPKAPLLPSYKAEGGSFDNPGFRALPGYVQAKIKSNMALGGFMGDYIDEDDTMEYGSGGYTVRRSNDRKGKTHVVTGPDGTKKYFGDPKLGERGKSKYGKKGFYARHKKNLAKNPYFRAYARATWEDGGYMNMLDSNVDMVDMETPMYEYGGSMMYGQGGGIHIDPSKRGTFKAQASRMGMGVQQAARTILNAPEGKYSPAMRKKANFARNFAKADGGYMYQMGGEMMPEEMMAAEQQAAMQQGQQPQGGGQEQIMQAIVEMLQQGLQPEQIVGELVKMGIPQEAAIQAVQMVMQQVQQSQGMQQQQQAAPSFEQGMMGQQQGAPAPATMRGGGRMYQMGGSLADNYLAQVNQYPVLKRGGGKLYYQQDKGLLPDEGYAAINQFENTMGTYDAQGNPTSMNMPEGYSKTGGSRPEAVTETEKYINNTIGIDTWNSLPDDIKTLWYDASFNSTDNKEYFLRALAQAVQDSDPNFQYPQNIGYTDNDYKNYRNNLSDQQALEIIRNADFTKNDVTGNFINILNQQRESIGNRSGFPKNYMPTFNRRAIDVYNNFQNLNTNQSSPNVSEQVVITPQKPVKLQRPLTLPRPAIPQLSASMLKKAEVDNTSAPPLPQYESPMGNYIAGGVGSMLGPLANAAAAAFAPDPTYTAAPKLGRYDYTPVALQRAQANQAMANTRQAIRMGAPTQSSYLANVRVALPSAGANYGSQIAQTRYGIDAQNMALANQEATLRAAQAEKNALMKDQSISNRWKLGMEAAAGTGRNIQGFSRDLAAKRMQDMMVNQLRTGDFSVIGYENVNGTLIPKLAPTGLANYNDGTVTAPDGQRYKYNPDTKNYELIPQQ